MTSLFVSQNSLPPMVLVTKGRPVFAHHGVPAGEIRDPAIPIGSTTVTFEGVVAGSEIRVYLPDTTEVSGIESCATDQALTWSVYAPGSPNNEVRIVIIHPDYKIKEFNYTSSVGNQSIPVQLERDKWYSNPA